MLVTRIVIKNQKYYKKMSVGSGSSHWEGWELYNNFKIESNGKRHM